MNCAAIHLNEIPHDAAKKLGLTKKRERSFNKEQVHILSLRTLAEMAS